MKPIKTEHDYIESIRRIEKLWGAKKDTPEGYELDLQCTLIELYDMKYYSITPTI